MEATFSEFSYGYAVTSELTSGKLGKLLGAPVFPSLLKEGQKGGGFDVKIPYGVPLFVQFKLSHYLKRSNASEWGVFNSSYFRMHLHPLRYSRQHSLLMALEKTNPDSVFYLAPEFHTSEDLDDAYLTNNVLRKSAAFSPLAIGSLPDDGPHYVSFCSSTNVAYLCSERQRPLEGYQHGETFLNRQASRVNRRGRKVDSEFFQAITRDILYALREREVFRRSDPADHLWTKAGNTETVEEKAQFAAYLSMAYFDAELFVLTVG